MEFKCHFCNENIISPHDKLLIFSTGDESGTDFDIKVFCDKHTEIIEQLGKQRCVQCRKDMDSCIYRNFGNNLVCPHCFQLDFINTNQTVHKTCCSLPCYIKEKNYAKSRKELEVKLICCFCGTVKEKMSKCKGCLKVYYCNRECQTKHWSLHRPVCEK